MFRRLLQDAASVSGRAGGAADLQLIASADAQLGNNSALQVRLWLTQEVSLLGPYGYASHPAAALSWHEIFCVQAYWWTAHYCLFPRVSSAGLLLWAHERRLAIQAAVEPDYRQLLADLEKEMDKVKEDAAENARMLREEAARAKEAATIARAEGARAQADAVFEKQRADRQNEYLEEQRLQMQQITDHSSQYQVRLLFGAISKLHILSNRP